MFYSPLRYPGGKNKLAKFIGDVCASNGISGHYVEPYSGGASVALYLLIEGKVNKVTINDLDRSIYAFWYCVLKKTNALCELVSETDINIVNWKKAKEVQKNKETANLLDLGFSTFYLNRTNMSGVINGGVIGGLAQNGKYKIDCRFNKEALIARIRKISELKKQIKLYRLDAIDLIQLIEKESDRSSTIYYFDPPYYRKGKSLYMNHLKHDDHLLLSDAIRKIDNNNWVLSYDDNLEIRKMYKWCEKKINKYTLFYTVKDRKIGKEILFSSKNLKFPKILEGLN